MTEYQVIARKFRPQTFKQVIGQDSIVTTLKNAIKFNRLAQAYLFCGSRGTGKTTLARIFAKALNCHQITAEGEPCETCSSCREITQGSSLDVIEIDGASNRGIDDIRQINETVAYASPSGGYKIYIIDEVHMLTKEAFNALLKTLEEPPTRVKFFFATTEPHKVLPTILSRCQRFNLSRIPLTHIVKKLAWEAQQLNVEIEEAALERLAQRAEGGLRDAESLLDQVIAFSEGRLTVSDVDTILGLMPQETFFELDQAVSKSHLAKAFEIAHQIFVEGKDLLHFIEGLIEHYRTILLIKLSAQNSGFLKLNLSDQKRYVENSLLYTQDQCLELINYLVEAQQNARFSSFNKINLEAILLHVLQTRHRLSIGQLVTRLHYLENTLKEHEESSFNPMASVPARSLTNENDASQQISSEALSISINTQEKPPKIETFIEKQKESEPTTVIEECHVETYKNLAITEDPTPSLADFEKISVTKKIVSEPPISNPIKEKKVVKNNVQIPASDSTRPNYEYDTLLQFAAIELEGKLQRH